MYDRKKRKRKKYFQIGSVLLGLLLVVLTNLLMKGSLLRPLEGLVRDGTLLISRTLELPFQGFQKKKQVESSSDYEALLLKNQELEKELKELKEIVGLKETLSEYDMVTALTVNRNMGYWYDRITINKGSKEGIQVGMPVVSSNGLIGKVEEVSPFNSIVRLLTTPKMDTKISVKMEVDGTYIYGLLTTYNDQTKLFEIEGISENTEIPIGSLVSTTGLGEAFPGGILLGKVERVTTDHFDLARLVEVKSEANFEDVGIVSVLKRKDLES